MTAQVDQLLGQVIVRGAGFLTPHNGHVLDGRITVRRAPRKDGAKFPPAVAVLKRGTVGLARISFDKDQEKVTYQEIPELSKKMPEGLPAGDYSLRIEGSAESSAFTVEDAKWREEVMAAPRAFASVLGSRTDPVYLQVTAEHLLDQKDEDAKPLPYLADVLDVLESVPEQDLTTHLKQLKRGVLNRLSGEQQPAPAPQGGATGVAQIDRARQLIAEGNWRSALSALDSGAPPANPRAGALATLYRGVILAESGLGTEDQARAAFSSAIEELSGSPADLYRAHNNFANFLLNNVQDLLYNHAFQMATGVRMPLLTAMRNWIDARQHYEAALQLAGNADPAQRAAVQVNLARLYALLADVIRTLDVAEDGKRQFPAAEEAALRQAGELAAQVCQAKDGSISPFIRASAEELLARLAFRRQQSQPCLRHAEAARKAYLEAGSLAGVEEIERLLGLYYLRQKLFDPRSSDTARSQEQSLRHFLLSLQLSELLRQRIPLDRIGLSQSGYFARRAYVNEKIIELLIAHGKPAEALRYAELAKARSLQDLLAVEQAPARTGRQENPAPPDTADLLRRWPKNRAALEYFIASDKAWLFLVDTKGNVTVHDLLGGKRTSRDLVLEIRQILDATDGELQRMRERLFAGKDNDHTWQDRLHDMYQTLIPRGVLRELQAAETVIVVPHHILHYFPFAALVTKRDERKRDRFEMVQPQFLIDESFDIVYAPSLSVWDRLRNVPDRPITQVGVVGIVEFTSAPALPGVELDLKNLKAAFGNKVDKIVFGPEATEAKVRPLLSRPGMLLFATHGENVADQPLKSHLLLKEDEHDDGLLTAKELFSSPVRCDMIVMSACYTGLANRSPLPGDDLFGIQRAMLQSGARTVVSGLWDVCDGTGPDLMKGFFDRLAKGQPAPAALAGSQREFLKKLRGPSDSPVHFVHPFFWAVYALSGDDRTHFAR